MQKYKEIQAQEYVNSSRTTINENLQTLQSHNSGTAFPTSNLFEGMKCYRTDTKKTYTLKGNNTWADDSLASKLAAAVTIALSGGATGTATSFDGSGNITIPVTSIDGSKVSGTVNKATKDSADQQINTTYIKNISISGTTVTITKGNGTTSTQTTQDTNTTYSAATQSANGLMSAADKKKLDGIAAGANAYSLPTASSSTLGGVKTGSNITNSSGTISLTKSNVTSALGYTPPTTNTTYSTGTASSSGITKLYTGVGDNTDGTMTQKAIKAIVGTGGGIIAASLAANGYVKFANGFILQWGTGTCSSDGISFPIAFPNGCYAVLATRKGATDGDVLQPNVVSFTKSKVFIKTGSAGAPNSYNYGSSNVNIVAIGK